MIKKAIAVFVILGVLCALMMSCGRTDAADKIETTSDSQQDNEGTKTDKGDETAEVFQYTWAEFEALSVEQQNAFIDMFESAEAFEAWMNKAQQEQIEKPWENSGKPVNEYTWLEFKSFSVEQQNAFIDMFESAKAFEAWMNKAQQEQIEKPWENGGKPVTEYTWAEFESLSVEQQNAFIDMFETVEAFEIWMSKAQQAQIEKPWENSGKPVTEYTWAEFDALSVEQKDAFFDMFESAEAFEAWMNKAQQEQIEKPWENSGKPVTEYTWAEFEALSVNQKDAFFDAFESVEAFEAWMEEAQNMRANEKQ